MCFCNQVALSIHLYSTVYALQLLREKNHCNDDKTFSKRKKKFEKNKSKYKRQLLILYSASISQNHHLTLTEKKKKKLKRLLTCTGTILGLYLT